VSDADPASGGERLLHTEIRSRLEDLEVKAAFMEDLVDRLDTVVVRQQQQIDLLIQEVSRLKQQTPDHEQRPARSLRDELPPHY
jgi:SlyX protein